MRLFREEHKKSWRRSSVRVGVLLCFLYIVVFGGFLSYQWFQFGTSEDYTSSFGKHFNGYESIRIRQEYAARWNGEVTDEKVQEMVRDYQRLKESDQDFASDGTDWRTLNQWVETLWPELEDPEETDIILAYVDPDSLTGFYERRQEQLGKFLDQMGSTEEEKTYFLEMDKKVEIPLTYGWVESWSNLLGSTLADMGKILGIFIAVSLAPLFAGETQSEMRSLILTTRYGRAKTAGAKAAVGTLFALELFGMMAAGSILLQVIYLGTDGWDLPIQCVKLIATAPWNMLQAEIYEYACILLALIGYAGIVMLLSAVCRTGFAAILISLAVIYVPMASSQYLPLGIQKLLDLIPLVGSPADIFRTNVYHIFGKIVWSPYLLITVPFLLGIVCIPICMRKWSGSGKKAPRSM